MEKVRYIFRGGMCALLYIFLVLKISAQSKTDSLLHVIDEVTVSGHKIAEPVTSMRPVQSLDGKRMKDLGVHDVADAARRFAGVSVRDYGGIGGLKTVSIRSLGAAHTAISYDGVTVSNTQAGQIDIGRFSLDNVEELTLSLGHANDLLQSARSYASAGLLSIYTKQPVFEHQNEKWSVGLRGGSFGYITPSLRYARKFLENTSLMLEGDYMRADGIYPFRLENGKLSSNEKRHNSDIYSWHIEANLFHTFTDSSRLKVKSHFYQSERGLPGVVILYNPTSRERLWDKNFFTQLVYDRDFSNSLSFRTLVKYTYGWSKYEDVNVKYANGKQTDVHRQNEYYASASLRWKPMNHWTMSLAQDLFVNTLNNNIDDSPNPVRLTSLTAVNADFRLKNLHVGASLNAAITNDHVSSGDTPEGRRHLSPSISLSYRPWNLLPLYLRAMYKNTFRIPTFNELYYRRSGNTSLKPEDATEYNIGVTWSSNSYGILDELLLTADVYYNKISDKIVAFPSVYVWRMANYGKVEIKGIDVTLTTSILPADWLKIRIQGSYTYQQALDKTNSKAKNYREQIPYTPRHSGNISLVADNPWVVIGYSIVTVGKRYFMDQNIPENVIEAYSDHSLSISKKFEILPDVALRVHLDISNLTDKQYEVIRYYPMPGRSWKIGGVLEF